MFIKILFLSVIYLTFPISIVSENICIDVVIPCHEKDSSMLEAVIEGAKNNIVGIRNIFIISEKPFTNSAQYFDESLFPFNKQKIKNIFEDKINRQLDQKEISQLGWYYQQLLKLYAAFVIPGISENILIIDADTVFMNKVTFINNYQEVLYSFSKECNLPYFDHIKRMLPALKKRSNYSGIAHHMLFEKRILDQLFSTIEKLHKKPFWEVFCSKVDPKFYSGSGASEYELYFNFALNYNNKARLRHLNWKNCDSIDYKNFEHFDYVSCHSYMRN